MQSTVDCPQRGGQLRNGGLGAVVRLMRSGRASLSSSIANLCHRFCSWTRAARFSPLHQIDFGQPPRPVVSPLAPQRLEAASRAWTRIAYILVNTALALAPSPVQSDNEDSAPSHTAERTPLMWLGRDDLVEALVQSGRNRHKMRLLRTSQLRWLMKQNKEQAGRIKGTWSFVPREELKDLCHALGIWTHGMTCAQMRGRIRWWQPPPPPPEQPPPSNGSMRCTSRAMLPTGAAKAEPLLCPVCKTTLAMRLRHDPEHNPGHNPGQYGDQAWSWCCRNCKQSFTYTPPADSVEDSSPAVPLSVGLRAMTAKQRERFLSLLLGERPPSLWGTCNMERPLSRCAAGFY
jgi:hypothetical protein